jgi:hypothetical protein
MATSYSINVGLGRDPYLVRVGNDGAGDRGACGYALSMEPRALWRPIHMDRAAPLKPAHSPSNVLVALLRLRSHCEGGDASAMKATIFDSACISRMIRPTSSLESLVSDSRMR